MFPEEGTRFEAHLGHSVITGQTPLALWLCINVQRMAPFGAFFVAGRPAFIYGVAGSLVLLLHGDPEAERHDRRVPWWERSAGLEGVTQQLRACQAARGLSLEADVKVPVDDRRS